MLEQRRWRCTRWQLTDASVCARCRFRVCLFLFSVMIVYGVLVMLKYTFNITGVRCFKILNVRAFLFLYSSYECLFVTFSTVNTVYAVLNKKAMTVLREERHSSLVYIIVISLVNDISAIRTYYKCPQQRLYNSSQVN